MSSKKGDTFLGRNGRPEEFYVHVPVLEQDVVTLGDLRLLRTEFLVVVVRFEREDVLVVADLLQADAAAEHLLAFCDLQHHRLAEDGVIRHILGSERRNGDEHQHSRKCGKTELGHW